MSSERSPVTHPANYSNQKFWREIDREQKKEILTLDGLYNKKFLETTHALGFGAISGLLVGLALRRISNRFVSTVLTSGFACVGLYHFKGSPIYDQYFKLWRHTLNDQKTLETIRETTNDMSIDEFHYYYHRYLKFYFPHLDENVKKPECKSCH